MRYIALSACLLLAGCATPFTPEGVAGAYDLETVDGQALPWVQGTDVILRGSVTLQSDGTYASAIIYEMGGSIFDHGTYALTAPDGIQLASAVRAAYGGTLVGGRLEVQQWAKTWSYRRR